MGYYSTLKKERYSNACYSMRNLKGHYETGPVTKGQILINPL